MPRPTPPAPKERAAGAAVSQSPAPVAPPPAPSAPSGNVVGLYVFVALIVLGLLASARAFFLLGA